MTNGKTNGSIGTRSAIGVLQITSLLIGALLIHKIDSATEKNSEILAKHTEKLAVHDSQFEAILQGHFTAEFSQKLRKYIVHEKR